MERIPLNTPTANGVVDLAVLNRAIAATPEERGRPPHHEDLRERSGQILHQVGMAFGSDGRFMERMRSHRMKLMERMIHINPLSDPVAYLAARGEVDAFDAVHHICNQLLGPARRDP